MSAHRSDPHRLPHRNRDVLLPSQNAAPRQSLRRAFANLHDLQQHREFADQARHRAERRGQRRHGPTAAGHGAQPGSVRGKRQGAGAFICNCCGCCCEALLAAKRCSTLSPIATTNFLPEVKDADCNGCGKCVEACPVEAMGLVSAGDPRHAKRKKTKVGQDVCLGCGVCVRTCDRNALALRARGKRVLTPVTTAHRTVLMAIERGKLQNLIFDIQLVGAFDGQPLSLVVGRDFKPPTIAPASFHFIRLEIRT